MTRYAVGGVHDVRFFSQHGELTVRDNLMLHARLFHLGEQKSTQRTEQLITEIGLSEYADEGHLAATTGLRQRLSLAVAIVHDPELLILTSRPPVWIRKRATSSADSGGLVAQQGRDDLRLHIS